MEGAPGVRWAHVRRSGARWAQLCSTLLNFAQLCSTFPKYLQPIRSSHSSGLLEHWLYFSVVARRSRPSRTEGCHTSHALYCKPHKDCARLTLADCALRVVDGLSSLRRVVDAQGSESMGRARAPAVSTLCQPRCAVDITRLKLRLRCVRCGSRRRAHHRLRSAALEQRLPPAL